VIPTYSEHGSKEFNDGLHRSLEQIADEVQSALAGNLVALILGGGYGRGEGGVIRTGTQEMPYNDLDFVVVVNSKSKLPTEKLRTISNKFGQLLSIHVDFSRPLTLSEIERWPCTLMWQDLLLGHVVLKGQSDVLEQHAPPGLRQPLPAVEATRLLLNRGAGLLWALRVQLGTEQPPDRDFVRRNYYKCALSLGDALLITYRRYTTQYRGRDEILDGLIRDEPQLTPLDLKELYREALTFKFTPDSVTAPAFNEQELKLLAQKWGEVFLAIERMRSGIAFKSLKDYVDWKGIREKDQHSVSSVGRNVARNLQMKRLSWRYPREGLYRSLPGLLGLVREVNQDWPKESHDFLEIWKRFN
jgi:hypothetical protein